MKHKLIAVLFFFFASCTSLAVYLKVAQDDPIEYPLFISMIIGIATTVLVNYLVGVFKNKQSSL